MSIPIPCRPLATSADSDGRMSENEDRATGMRTWKARSHSRERSKNVNEVGKCDSASHVTNKIHRTPMKTPKTHSNDKRGKLDGTRRRILHHVRIGACSTHKILSAENRRPLGDVTSSSSTGAVEEASCRSHDPSCEVASSADSERRRVAVSSCGTDTAQRQTARYQGKPLSLPVTKDTQPQT